MLKMSKTVKLHNIMQILRNSILLCQGHNQSGGGGAGDQSKVQPPLSPPNEMALCTGVY